MSDDTGIDTGTSTATRTGTRIGTAFVPVSDPAAAADWYARSFGLTVQDVSPHAAQLSTAQGTLTLMGPRSGIAAEPGLPWAPFSLDVDDLAATREELIARGAEVSAVDGDPAVCLFFTTRDLDGNVVLVVDR